MKRQLLKNSSVLFVVIVFSLMAGVALADKKHWFVVKDKGGMCRVIEAETISGPFKTMEEAEKRKAKECPKGAGQATEQLRPHQEQAEPMRRQHQQREEPQKQDLKQLQTPRQQQLEAPQQQQQTEKMKGKAQEKIEGAKSPEEKVKEKTKETIPPDKKN
jgi:membrane protein involved in colicin uptake